MKYYRPRARWRERTNSSQTRKKALNCYFRYRRSRCRSSSRWSNRKQQAISTQLLLQLSLVCWKPHTRLQAAWALKGRQQRRQTQVRSSSRGCSYQPWQLPLPLLLWCYPRSRPTSNKSFSSRTIKMVWEWAERLKRARRRIGGRGKRNQRSAVLLSLKIKQTE